MEMEMIGGLLKTTSLAAIAAVAFAFTGAVAPVKAADLGGNCCADLEERIAELEATTVRKGNRKVSVTLSGFVGHNVMWWNDGKQSDMYIGDGGNYFSRFRFRGEAKISPSVTAGFLYEFGISNNTTPSFNQLNGGDDLGSLTTLRDQTVWLRHNQLGMIKIGQGSTATDNLVLIDLGGMAGASTPDTPLYMGSFLLRGKAGGLGNLSQNWYAALSGNSSPFVGSWDTQRLNHILYETPTIAGFSVQAAVAEDNFWDVALRYAGEFNGFRLAFGIGYLENTEWNSPLQAGAGTGSVICTSSCDLKVSDLKGSASILHVPTGLFLTGAAGQRQLDGTGTVGVDDLTMWYLAGGVRRNFFGYGDTVLFADYQESKGGLSQATVLNPVVGVASDSKVTYWGLGVNQYIDAAAMEVFVAYKHFELDAPGLAPVLGSSAADFQMVIGGARVNF